MGCMWDAFAATGLSDRRTFCAAGCPVRRLGPGEPALPPSMVAPHQRPPGLCLSFSLASLLLLILCVWLA